MLTRATFRAVAEQIKALRATNPKAADMMQEDAIVRFSASNPRFDATRFRNACALDASAPKAKRARARKVAA